MDLYPKQLLLQTLKARGGKRDMTMTERYYSSF